MRKWILPVLVLGASVFLVPVGADEEAQKLTATNMAGRNRFLTQKSLKEVLQVMLAVNVDASKQDLAKSIDTFEKQLAGLVKGDAEMGVPAPSAAVAGELAKFAPLWKAYRVQLDATLAGKGDLDALLAANASLLEQAEAAVKAFEAELKTKAGPAISRAMRQRMLSQKMANQIYLIALKKNVDAARQQLQAVSDTFGQVLLGFQNGDAALGLAAAEDPAVRRQLEGVAATWTGFQPLVKKGLEGGNFSADELAQVAAGSTRLLTESNTVCTLLEAAAKGK